MFVPGSYSNQSFQANFRECCYCNCSVLQEYKSLAKRDEINISTVDNLDPPAVRQPHSYQVALTASYTSSSSTNHLPSLTGDLYHSTAIASSQEESLYYISKTRGTQTEGSKRLRNLKSRRSDPRKLARDFFADPLYGLLGTICANLLPAELGALEITSKRLSHSIMVNEVWKCIGEVKFRNIGFNGADQFLDPSVDKFQMYGHTLMFRCTDICCSWTKGYPMIRPGKDEIDWKGRYKYFAAHSLAFRSPDLYRITRTPRRDYVSYLQASMMNSKQGIYCEVLIDVNDDNLSLSVVDYDDGGQMSSITFSPDTGAVIKERKMHENPRLVHGTYAQCLPQTMCPFRGRIGLYLKDGWLAFYRKGYRWDSIWQTTNFCTQIDAALAADGRAGPPAGITPCLAFRDAGNYVCSIVKICRDPPMAPVVADDIKWQPLTWDAGEHGM